MDVVMWVREERWQDWWMKVDSIFWYGVKQRWKLTVNGVWEDRKYVSEGERAKSGGSAVQWWMMGGCAGS